MSRKYEDLSRNNKVLLMAYHKGYRVIDNNVISPLSGRSINTRLDSGGYVDFTIRDWGNVVRHVKAHRLKAFQKFGYQIFLSGIEVRHLDGDKTNTLGENISVGTSFQNKMDIPPEVRMRTSIKAATKLRKFTDDEVSEIRKKHELGRTYKMIMEEYGITSKGTMSHIINNKYKTKK
jgi:hypothetical protein